MGVLSDWNGYFEAARRPNFGDVHTKYGTSEFEPEYLWSETLKDFHFRLLDTLTGQFEMLNLLITGTPGIGKTSFLYYLRHRFEQDPNSRHVIKIFHSNHGRGFKDSKDSEERVQEEILDAWATLFKTTGHELTFSQIAGADHPLRKKLNELSDYYLRNKSKFNKLLIFAVDDVDLLDRDELRQVVKFVVANLEAKSVKKWFFVRPQTYQEYDDQTKEFLQGFFPDVRQLPKTRLHDLVKHRIAAVSSNKSPKVPFSPHLCSYIEDIVGGNLRRALPALEHILCEVPPPAKDSQSEEFVRNHIDKVAIRSLVGRKLIPDIHSPDLRTVPYPIPLDVVRFLMFTADIALVKPCVDDALRNRAMRSPDRGTPRRYTPRNGKPFKAPYVRDVDLMFTLERLQKAQLVEKTGSAYRLTPLGKVVSVFASQSYFLTESIVHLRTDGIDFDEDYLRLAAARIDHESIIQPYILRKF